MSSSIGALFRISLAFCKYRRASLAIWFSSTPLRVQSKPASCGVALAFAADPFVSFGRCEAAVTSFCKVSSSCHHRKFPVQCQTIHLQRRNCCGLRVRHRIVLLPVFSFFVACNQFHSVLGTSSVGGKHWQ